MARPGNALSLPLPDEVRAQLARILCSPEFVVPERVRSFLRYLVEQTLAGRADRLKGYTIATAVFERGESFDAQADPVVRTEAGRLRRALERYYLVEGQADPVLIEVPKGCYVPSFSRRAPLPRRTRTAVEAQPAAAEPIPGSAARPAGDSATVDSGGPDAAGGGCRRVSESTSSDNRRSRRRRRCPTSPPARHVLREPRRG